MNAPVKIREDPRLLWTRRGFLGLTAAVPWLGASGSWLPAFHAEFSKAAGFRRRLRELTASWWKFMDRHLWEYPHRVGGITGLVYGTGYASWGAWAHINAALFAAVSSGWEDELFTEVPEPYRTREGRLQTALRLIAYSLCYHSTGELIGAGGDRWGSEPVREGWKEGYNNWHSPIWLTFLAEAALALGDDLPPDLMNRLERAVIHDADIQCRLDPRNFDGSARDLEVRTHLESNSWKASLLTLARSLFPKHPHYRTWWEREVLLWASSFALPGEDQLDEEVDGFRLKDIVRGSHVTHSYVGNHHGFPHPGYMTWPLLSRAMAREWAEGRGSPLPQVAARHEREVFHRLLGFYDSGRLIYPGGQDWPRWIYAQAYFLVVALHYFFKNGQDYPFLPVIAEELLETRRKDREASGDGGQVTGRLLPFYGSRAFELHRYETDMLASAALADLLLGRHAGQPWQTAEHKILIGRTRSRFEEPLSDLIYEKDDRRIVSVCWRAHGGPVQITALPLGYSYLAEWQANGAPSIRINHLPWEREKTTAQKRYSALFGGGSGLGVSLSMFVHTDFVEASLIQMDVLFIALPESRLSFCYQRVIGGTWGSARSLTLHNWNFACDAPAGERRTLYNELSPAGETVSPAEPLSNGRLGRWCNLDGALGLIGLSGDCRELAVDLPRERNNPQAGIRYGTISTGHSQGPLKFSPGQVVREGAVLVLTGSTPAETGRSYTSNRAIETSAEGWLMWKILTPENQSYRIAFRSGREAGELPAVLTALQKAASGGSTDEAGRTFDSMGWCVLRDTR